MARPVGKETTVASLVCFVKLLHIVACPVVELLQCAKVLYIGNLDALWSKQTNKSLVRMVTEARDKNGLLRTGNYHMRPSNGSGASHC